MPNIKVTRAEFESYWVNRHRRQRRLTRYSFVNDEAAAVAERFATPMPEALKPALDAFFTAVKDGGVLALADVLKMHNVHDEQAAQQNWVQDAHHSIFVNSPTFTPFASVHGDGATSYYSNDFNPVTAVGAHFTQNSASHFIWSLTNLNNGGASSSDAGALNSQISRQGAVSGQALGRANTSVGILIGPGAYPGFCGWSRTGASVWNSYGPGGVDIGGGTDASAAMTNADMRGCSVNASAFGVNELMMQFIGGGLSPAQVVVLSDAATAWKAAVDAYAATL